MIKRIISVLFCALISSILLSQSPLDSTKLTRAKTVKGKITPKSIVYANGKLFAQNMMYSHTLTVYDTTGKLLKTIKDTVTPSSFIDTMSNSLLQGSPVEAALATNDVLWVSNYQMYGKGYTNPGCDGCRGNSFDKSFMYGFNSNTLKLEKIIPTGSVPKFISCDPTGKWMAVSNWVSGSVSIYNQQDGTPSKEIFLGRYPRGSTFNHSGTHLYVAIMGDDKIADIDLISGQTTFIEHIGDAPRHILYNDSTLYFSCNNDATVRKLELSTMKQSIVKVGAQPRSMAFSSDSSYLYVVNYSTASLTKISCSDLNVKQTIKTDAKPIGVTVVPESNSVWVACYGGSLIRYNQTKANVVHTPKEETIVYNPEPNINITSNYHVIVASFMSLKEAQAHVNRLANKGMICTVLPPDKGRYRVSYFSTNKFSEAKTKQTEARKWRKDAWVLKKS